MKKTAFIFAAIVMLSVGAGAQEKGQRNCDTILQPYFALHGYDAETYPAGKAEYRCRYSENAFYFVDDIPNGVPLHQMDELTDLLTGEHPTADMVVDLSTLSYYRYDFNKFQGMHRKSPVVYFRLRGNNSHQFLALRSFYAIEELVWKDWVELDD